MTNTRAALALAGGAVLLLSACSASSPEPEGSAAGLDLVRGDALTVCTNPPYEPFEYEEDGEIVGFDIAIVQEVADDLGVELNAISTGFEGIQSGAALEAQTCDIVASGITITEERQQNLDFSNPYFSADQAVLVESGSDIAAEADLEGLTVGVQQATTGADWATEAGLESAEFEDLGLQIQALRNGQIDAAINDVAVLGAYAGDGLEVAFTISTGEEYGLGVRKGNTELLDAVNGTLERITTDGTYDELSNEYIGVSTEPSPAA